MSLDAGDSSGRLAGQPRDVVVGRGIGPGVEQVVNAQLHFEMGIDLVAHIEIDLAVPRVLRVPVAVADRISTQLAPLQAARPRPQIVHQRPEGADESGSIADVGTVQTEGPQLAAAIAGFGRSEIRVELQPAQGAVSGGQLDALPATGCARLVLT